jgi:integrase
VAEWFKAAVLKTAEVSMASVGSNPTPSAILSHFKRSGWHFLGQSGTLVSSRTASTCPMGERGVYERGPAQYQVKIRKGGHKVTRTFETRQEALQWRNVVVGQIDGHEYIDRTKERRATLKELLQRYEREVTEKKKGKSQETYRIRQWMAEPFAAWSLPAVDSATIADWIKKKKAQGLAPSTISNAVNLLSAVFKIAIAEWSYKVSNPCVGVSRPKARPARKARLTPDQEGRLLEECHNGPQWLIWCVKLAILTAMRASEIRQLRWQDIHGSHIHLSDTKNDESRDVPLTSAASSVIKQMCAELPKRADGWVFGDPWKKKKDCGFTKDMLSQAYRDAARKAGIGLTFHDLRHVATTRLAPLHRDVLELAATTGHKTLDVLKDYFNPDPAERAAALRYAERAAARRRHRATKPRKLPTSDT